MKTKECPIHKVPLTTVTMTFCRICRKHGGSTTSRRKARASRKNGKLGGRPIGSKDSKPRKRQTETRRAVLEASSRR
jgi:hypothetical protein